MKLPYYTFNLTAAPPPDFDYLFPEQYQIEQLNSNQTIRFTGIKTGDVNSSAKGVD
jgi:hypothetical protein